MTISIICPAYNEEKYIEQCITSVLNQSYTDIELIIVNDGSTDGTGEICDKYAKKDSRVKVIHQENQGVSVARENGFLMATGDYIGFIDGDDYIAADMYEVLMGLLVKYDVDISMCEHFVVGMAKESKISPLGAIASVYGASRNTAYRKEKINYNDWDIVLWNKVYRRELFNKIDYNQFKLIAPRFYFDDVILSLLLLHNSEKIVMTTKKLYYYRMVENSMDQQKKKEFNGDIDNEQKIVLDMLKEFGYKEIYAERLRVYGNHLIKHWIENKSIDALTEFKREFVFIMKNAKCSPVYKMSFVIFRFSPALWTKIAKIYPATHINGEPF